jgi:hypothetical protein
MLIKTMWQIHAARRFNHRANQQKQAVIEPVLAPVWRRGNQQMLIGK